MKKVKVSFVGSGMIANSAHLPALLALGDAVEIVGVQDTRPEAAAFMAEKLGVPAFASPEEMYDGAQPDLAVITTPNLSHTPLSVQALEHGIGVVCEKPVTLTYKDAQAIYAAAKKSGAPFFPAQTMRFTQDVLSLHEFAGMGTFGDIYFCDIEFLRRRGIPKWGMFHLKEENGGGPFADIAVHMVDALVSLTGTPKLASVVGCAYSKLGAADEEVYLSIEEAGALAGGIFVPREYKKGEFGVEEFSSGLIRFESGMSIQFRVSWAINLPSSETMNLRIAGTKGGYSLADETIYSKLGKYRADIKPTIVDNTCNERGWGHWEMYRHIMDVLAGKCEYAVKEQELLTTSAIIEGYYKSAAEGREVLAEEIIG